ncbi:hypothetical protein PGT21_021500 [Puccinia graminis f. sp. tritici]|uniref:Uncharacterized protein n=1 Tax=Puccinia graminis f. sp. tritici TaxID=56615 RepID=A0A5B0M3V8_PUCGR|nr:hypothetical protein PGT21_021500 [Puccinia graminis f. sp. tritici]
MAPAGCQANLRETNPQVGMSARSGWSILVRQTNRQPVGCPWVRKVGQPCLPEPSYAVICRPAAGSLNGPDSGVGIVVNICRFGMEARISRVNYINRPNEVVPMEPLSKR